MNVRDLTLKLMLHSDDLGRKSEVVFSSDFDAYSGATKIDKVAFVLIGGETFCVLSGKDDAAKKGDTP